MGLMRISVGALPLLTELARPTSIAASLQRIPDHLSSR